MQQQQPTFWKGSIYVEQYTNPTVYMYTFGQ